MAANSVSSAVVDTPGGVNVPINVEAITQPVAETSRRMYQKVADSAQWYGEQWEDLLVEAKHMALGANRSAKLRMSWQGWPPPRSCQIFPAACASA